MLALLLKFINLPNVWLPRVHSFLMSEVVILLSCPSVSKCFTVFFTATTLSDCCCPFHCYILNSHSCENQCKKKPIVQKCNKMLRNPLILSVFVR